MILNTGSRTDIPAYFSDWFYKRIEEGTESLLSRTGDQICAESICGGCAGILYEESAADDKQAGTSQYL